jgi:N-acetylmuramoyl-L-alanine amidase
MNLRRNFPKAGVQVLIFSLLVIFSVAGANGAPSIDVSGKEYLPVAGWASAKGFDLRWAKREETFQLSTSSSRVVLNADSREAQVNGVQVWLSFPIIIRNGMAYAARSDLETTLQPLVSPPRNRGGAAVNSICLDPGHGGKDPGNCVGTNQEKKYTLLLAQEVRDQLNRAGFKASLTRTGDRFIELPNRPELAKRRGADLFVSLHFNATEGSRNQVQGAQVFCLTPPGASSTNARGEGAGAGSFAGNRFNEKNILLAYQVQKNLTKTLSAEDRGVRRARFAVLRDAAMPAVLIEGGFMSHPDEGKKIFDAGYRRKMARAIVDGLLAYKRTVEREG